MFRFHFKTGFTVVKVFIEVNLMSVAMLLVKRKYGVAV
jgi:hypothetical protein